MTPHKHRNPRLRAAMIIRDDDGRFLLLQHEREHGRYWVLPGGGVDVGESVEDAVCREVKEELGVNSEVEKLVAVGELILPERHVVDFFLAGKIERRDNLEIRWEEGISDYGWFSANEAGAMNLLPGEIKEILAEMADGLRHAVKYLGRYEEGE